MGNMLRPGGNFGSPWGSGSLVTGVNVLASGFSYPACHDMVLGRLPCMGQPDYHLSRDDLSKPLGIRAYCFGSLIRTRGFGLRE